MPFPLLAALGVSIGSQILGGLTGQSAAKKNAKMEAAAAARAFSDTVGDIEARRVEELRASTNNQFQLVTASAQEQGTAQASAAESGLGGQGKDSIKVQFDRALALALGANAENLKMTNKQLDRDITGAASGAISRTNAAKAAVPSGFSVGANIVGGVAQTVLPYIPVK